MGFGIRTFKVDLNGHLRRFPYARLKRLYDGEAREALPEHAGGYADFAIVYVRTHVDRPVVVTNLEFTRLHLDAAGRFNETERLRRLQAAGDLLDTWYQDQYRLQDSSRILPAANRFARKRHDREFSWEPSKAQWATLAKLLDSWPQKLPRG